MALWLRATGIIESFLPSGRSFTLPELQGAVGGYIELAIRIPAPGTASPRCLIVNEDGKRLGLPLNRNATAWYHLAGGNPHDVIVGDAVLTTRAELGEEEEECPE